jgi:succinate dehydrogenase / fumarate reductase, cytochrome b subunit
MDKRPVDSDFFMRKLHSVMGLGLVLFLMEHLLTNSESALMFGKDGSGFIKMVNFIHSIPYLKVVEVLLIGIPLLIHMVYGVKYLLTGAPSIAKGKGDKPHLPYERNYRYTLQRITSWLLLVAILLHVIQMRFLEVPTEVFLGTQDSSKYLVALQMDDGLYSVSKRLKVQLYDQNRIVNEHKRMIADESKIRAEEEKFQGEIKDENKYQVKKDYIIREQERLRLIKRWVLALESIDVEESEVVASADNIGTAFLLKVRETFMDPLARVLYSIFVLAAAFHASNGLWTLMMSWGITLSPKSQSWAARISVGLMLLLSFLGMVSIWGTYLVNLRV